MWMINEYFNGMMDFFRMKQQAFLTTTRKTWTLEFLRKLRINMQQVQLLVSTRKAMNRKKSKSRHRKRELCIAIPKQNLSLTTFLGSHFQPKLHCQFEFLA